MKRRVGDAVEKHTVCPWCGHVHDLVSVVGAKTQAPDNGDIGLCIRCGEWIIYEGRLATGMRRPTFDEYQDIIANPVASDLRAAWLATKPPD
jgi:hypothetical protein